MAASIKEFGFRQPIVVDSEYVLIVGHTRLLAAKSLGLNQVPVHVAEDLTDAQIKAYRIADNRTNEEATWDDELLRIELGDLECKGFNLELTGFDADELDRLMLPTETTYDLKMRFQKLQMRRSLKLETCGILVNTDYYVLIV